MRQGIADVLKYYALAIVVSVVAIFFFGFSLGHGRGEITLIIPAIFVIIAFCWMIVAVLKAVTTIDSQRIKDQIWTHIVIFILIGIALSFVPVW